MIVVWIVAVFLIVLILASVGEAVDEYNNIHHDSRKGSFYEISNRKENK